MADALEIAKVRLPVGVQGADLISLHEQMTQRVTAVVQPTGGGRRKGARPDDDQLPTLLPDGVQRVTKLPDLISGPWSRFGANVGALANVRSTRDRAAAGASAADVPIEQGGANNQCDGAFRALESWLDAWTQSQDDGHTPTPADAQWLYQSLFPADEGLRFINYRPRRQWMAMKPRMETLAGERAQKIINGLGGTRLYRQLASAHERFGRAYGFLAITADVDGGAADTRPEFLAAKDSLRDLVRKLDAYAEPTVPGSEALSAFLLKPYIDLIAELTAAQQRTARKPAVEMGTTPDTDDK